MKSLFTYVLTAWLTLTALIGQAQEQTDKMAPEPTVGVFWVGVFVALFVGLCIWFLVAMIRSERRSKATEEKAS